jgi:hypothetical protein
MGGGGSLEMPAMAYEKRVCLGDIVVPSSFVDGSVD